MTRNKLMSSASLAALAHARVEGVIYEKMQTITHNGLESPLTELVLKKLIRQAWDNGGNPQRIQ